MAAIAISSRITSSFYPNNNGTSEASNDLQKVFEDCFIRLRRAETWDHPVKVLSELKKNISGIFRKRLGWIQRSSYQPRGIPRSSSFP